MKYEKGIYRLALVLSILAGPIVFCILGIVEGLPNDLEYYIWPYYIWPCMFLGVLGFAVVWAIFFTVLWIIKGFRGDEKKNA